MPNPAEAYDDDAENADVLRPIPENAAREHLMESLKSAQLYIAKLLSENRSLKQENSNLKATTSKKRRNAAEDTFGYTSEIIRWAKAFLFTCALYIDTTAFQKLQPEYSRDVRDHFSSDEEYTHIITRALYNDIPAKFHPLLNAQEYSNFAKDFIHEHGDGRSTLLNNIRKALPVIAGLLRFPADKKATLWAPILFPTSTQNMNLVFTGPMVMQIHRLMYFGPGSLVPGKSVAQNSNGIRLGFWEVTEASISASAILARFVLSLDKEWASKGAISGTDYEKEYRTYHQMLTCHRHLLHVKEIIKTIHKFVFTGITPVSAVGADTDDDDGAETAIIDAMRCFELGSDEIDDAGEVTGATTETHPVPREPPAIPAQLEASQHGTELPDDPEPQVEVTLPPRRQRATGQQQNAAAGATASGSGSGVGTRTTRGRRNQ
ncbi:hypothetical protein DFH07DRAFT_958830 [Mycena maculata]|uniref:Uncharacterized protein n=1 Tax=Mycena maculata TaxID=230809 RepID=A0AAD7J6B6_9AGAR|nr:hypothetical protein DFH07DRAFT_958830 [Mycena maculata]